MIRLTLIRHPPVEAPGLCYGQADLTAQLHSDDLARIESTLHAASSRPARNYEAVWSSPAARCRALAAPLAAARGLEVEEDARLWELCFGDWERRKWADLEQEPEFLTWMRDWQTVAPPGGESLPELRARLLAWLGVFRSRAQSALVVTHAGVIRALRVELAGWNWNTTMNTPVPHLTPLHFDL